MILAMKLSEHPWRDWHNPTILPWQDRVLHNMTILIWARSVYISNPCKRVQIYRRLLSVPLGSGSIHSFFFSPRKRDNSYNAYIKSTSDISTEFLFTFI